MSLRIGIDVGGTFTDFYVAEAGREPVIHKVLSTPHDPSIGVITGLEELAAQCQPPLTLAEYVSRIHIIVHGTTVSTNATLTHTGAKCGLITTRGVRDALEMRRGVREEQYNNRYTNASPLVPRFLRIGVGGRLDRTGCELEPLSVAEIDRALELFNREQVEAVAICFMNAFANPAHERQAAALVRAKLPDAYLTVSSDLLPSIRFYDRLSTTVLNSYVGPKLSHYLEQLMVWLKKASFGGQLLIMQSNGGVMTPEVAREQAARTLLSGPAGGPGAGLACAGVHGHDRCITVDMGGTSFEASLAVRAPMIVNDGKIDRYSIALPMLAIHTIGAGGGSIGWIDEGGMLRMGPHSAGADPGPACYGRGGARPTSTDANLVLGYLNPDFFAGGRMKLDVAAAERAISEHVAKPLGLSMTEAAAGMYRIICNNMAQGVREVTIKRGFDPREFPMVVAGGAGPIHSCLICEELEMPLQIVPRESSVLCAFGMLMGEIRHDFVRTFVSRLEAVDWRKLQSVIEEMARAGDRLLEGEKIPPDCRRIAVKFDCRYLKQYHEVSFEVQEALINEGDAVAIAALFHAEHNRLYGYSLEEQRAPVEIINVRLQAVGLTQKPSRRDEPFDGTSADGAIKGVRPACVHEDRAFRPVRIYDGHRLKHGNHITGPAIIEQVTTAILVSASCDCICDRTGSFTLYKKGREDLVVNALQRGAEA